MLGPAQTLLATIISLDSGTSMNTLAGLLLVTGARAVIHHTGPVEFGRDGVALGIAAVVVVGAAVVVAASKPVPALLARLVGLLEPGTTTTSIVGRLKFGQSLLEFLHLSSLSLLLLACIWVT